jgi:hypothetical protein
MNDYRSHLSVTLWAALAALALGTVLPLPERTFSAQIFGSPVTVLVTARMLTGLVAVVIACAGLEAAIRTHPRPELLNHTYRYWGLPSAIVLTAAAVLPTAPSDAWWLVGLTLTGLALGAAAIAEYHVIDHDHPRFHNARLALNGLCYTLAALAFVLIYSSRSRSLISATLISGIGGLLALDLLRESTRGHLAALLYSAVTAVVLAQFTWVLNYWPHLSIRVGMILLVVFYLLVGLAHQELLGRLSRLRAAEYLALAGIVAALLVWFP